MADLAIDHVQIAIPVGGEDAARVFYGALLGLAELPKPPDMAARGGCWFQLGSQQLHMGVEADFRAAKKAHVALVTVALDDLRARIEAAGCLTTDDSPVDGRQRFFTEDPFGNRIEFIDASPRNKLISNETISIRPAIESDADAIDAIHRAAFAASELGYRGEAELVRALAADGDALVSLVATRDGAVVGHILFSRMMVDADGTALRSAGLAPVAVLPAEQGMRTGSQLIRAGLDQLRTAGVQISFVLGHADYYPRFGYSAALAQRFQSPFAGSHLMALMLDSGVPTPQSGRADYAPAFGRMG